MPARRHRAATAAAVGGLAVSNVVANRALLAEAYVPWNLGVAAGLVGLARTAGATWADLGLAPTNLGRGIRVGLGSAGLVALGGIATLGATRAGALHDRRVTELRPGQAWFQATVRIPLGTVLLEEVAFRGVLPALLPPSARPTWTSDVTAAALFGLWHVLPSRELVTANDGAQALVARLGPTRTRALAVGSTTLGGLAFSCLRRRGRHLAAPVLTHWATNSLGLVVARVAGHLGTGSIRGRAVSRRPTGRRGRRGWRPVAVGC